MDEGMNKQEQKQLDDKLIEASENGHIDVVRELLAAGADVHAYDDHALRWSSENGHVDVVKVLLDAGANVHANNDLALRWASYSGHVDVVKVLLAAGANLHADDDCALRWASRNSHVDVVLALAEYAKLNEQQAQKWYNVIVEHSKQHQLLLCVLPLITRWMKA
jgi:ankyrin repeat protein